MLVESAIGLTGCYFAYRKVNSEYIETKKIKRNAKKKWNLLMDGLGTEAENKIKQEYNVLDVIVKHYGVDLIVSIPSGRSYEDILKLVPRITITYKANVMCNLSPDKSSAYIRLHFIGKDISAKDKLKFNFFKTFINLDGCKNKEGETLYIKDMTDITSPEGKLVGYKINTKIPYGVKFDKIKDSYDTIVRTMGKCFMDFNFKKMELEMAVIHDSLDNKTKFYPIKVRPWELYIGMGHDWESLILDYSISANALVGGTQGTGKTNAIISAFINLCTQCDEDFKLIIGTMGEKQDFRVFKNVKQCAYYADGGDNVLKALRYLKKEMDRRNKLFASLDGFVFNIFEYNEMVEEKDRLPIIHFLADEIADFMDNDLLNPLLWDIIRKSRSAGIYFTVATQRASVKNLSPEFKAQLKNSISFYQPNVASALTVANGEDMAKKVVSLEKSREFVCSYQDGVKTGKTLFLDRHMMEKLLKPVLVKDKEYLNLDKMGNIVEVNNNKEEQTKSESRFEKKYKNKNSNNNNKKK